MKANATLLKAKLGCWLRERGAIEFDLRFPWLAGRFGRSWLDWGNRDERFARDNISGGRISARADASTMTVTRVFPAMGRRLLRHVLREYPMALNFTNEANAPTKPEVSFLIPIGGNERLPQFGLALASARAQLGVTCEVIVVEQSPVATLSNILPKAVRYVHQHPPASAQGFNKSWALNRGAREARSEILILLDADFLVPAAFARECHRILQVVEATRPARFIFNLDRESSERLAASQIIADTFNVESVVANTPMPLAIRASTYWQVGGHDEAYEGWGGEDSEFVHRVRTRRVAEGGWLPVLHAWHPPAAKKRDGDRNQTLHEQRMGVSVDERIRRQLTSASGGDSPQLCGNGKHVADAGDETRKDAAIR